MCTVFISHSYCISLLFIYAGVREGILPHSYFVHSWFRHKDEGINWITPFSISSDSMLWESTFVRSSFIHIIVILCALYKGLGEHLERLPFGRLLTYFSNWNAIICQSNPFLPPFLLHSGPLEMIESIRGRTHDLLSESYSTVSPQCNSFIHSFSILPELRVTQSIIWW